MLRSPNRIGQRTSNPQVARSNRARSATYPGVAQSGYEQESYKLLVGGSNPPTRTILSLGVTVTLLVLVQTFGVRIPEGQPIIG